MPIWRRHGIDYLDTKTVALPQCLKHTDVSSALPAKTVVVADEQLAKPKPPALHQLDEIFRGEAGQCFGERNPRRVVDSRFGKHLELFLTRGEKEGRRGGVYDFERVRI